MSKDYGRKPYMEAPDKGDYISMMKAITKQQVMSTAPYSDSQFEKPYNDDTDYPEMQHFYPKQFRDIDFPTLEFPKMPIGPTPDNPCAGYMEFELVVNGNEHEIWSNVRCGETIYLSMAAGHALTWCSDVMNTEGLEFGTDRDFPGMMTLKLPCKCDDYSLNVLCTSICDGFSNAIINVSSPEVTGVMISGSDTPTGTAAGYTAVGGIAPYTWSASCGSVNTGIDTASASWDFSGCCGTATISVTDDCGSTASLTVRMPTGTWVLVETCTATCLHFGCGWSASNDVAETTSNKWVIGVCGCSVTAETNCFAVLGFPGWQDDCVATCGYLTPYKTSGMGYKYEWQCP